MPTIREYLVSLGAEVDNKSFSKFNAALKGAGVTAAKFGAGMAALMTMVAKTSISLDKTTQAYDAMAKKQHKSIELIRAQETALKILGKTQKEVDADKELKAQYKELKALGKEMTFPTVAAGEKTLRGFLQDFDKFRMVSTYAINWVNHEFLSKIAAPLGETRKGLQEFTERLKKNMPQIADRVSQVFSNMFRLALAGVNAFGKLLEKIDKLPPAIKLIGAAIVAAFGLSKFGPVMLIIGGITTILALLDDYQTWLRGGNAALGEFWAAMKDGTGVDYMKRKLGELPGKIKEVNDKITEFMSGFFTKGEEVATEIIKGLANHDWTSDGQFIGKFFGDLVTNMLTFINTNLANSGGFLSSWAEVGNRFVVGLSETIGTAIATFPWDKTLTNLMTGANNLLTILGDVLFGEKGENGEQLSEGMISAFSDVARNLVSGIAGAFFKLKPADVAADIGGVVNHVFELISGFFSAENNSEIDTLMEHFTVTAGEIAEKIFNIIGETFSNIDMASAGATIGNAMNSIMERVIAWLGVASTQLPFVMKSAKDNMKKVATGILTFLGSAFQTIKLGDVKDIISGVFTVITGFLHSALQDNGSAGILKQSFDLMSDVALGLAEAILGGISSLNFEQVSADIGSFVNRLFEFVAQIFSESTDKDGKTKSLTDRIAGLSTMMISIAQGMVNGIASAFGKNGLHLENVTAAVSSILKGIFGLIGDVFSTSNVNGAADVMSSLLSVGGEVAKGLVTGIANMFTGENAIGLSDVTAPIKNILGGIFRLIGNVFSKENAETLGDIVGSVADIGLNLGVGIINAIGDLFGKGGAIPLDKVSGSIGTFISTLFQKVAEYAGKLLEKDEGGQTFGDKLGTSFTGVANALVKGIGDAMTTLTSAGVGESLGNGLDKLFKLIASLFTPENIGSLVGVALSIGETAQNIVSGIVKEIGSAFGQIDAAYIGTNVATGIEAFFTAISNWFSDQISSDENGSMTLLGNIGDTISTIADKIATMLGTGLAHIADSGVITQFATNLGTFLTKGITDLASKISTGEGIDFTEIGKNIGTAIGAAIKIGGDFFKTLVTEFWTWLNSGGTDDLVAIGKAILDGILAGLGSIYDAIMTMIFGEDYTNAKKKGEDFNKENQEIFDEMKEEGVGYQEASMIVAERKAHSEQRETQQSTTFANGTPLRYYDVDSLINSQLQTLMANGGSMPKEMRDKFSGIDLNNITESYKRGNFSAIKDVFSKLYGFENYEQVLKGMDESGWDAIIPQIKIEADTTQAMTQLQALKDAAAKGITVPMRTTGGGDGEPGKALGGRFSTATRGVFGEDGTEYIIPITKPSRAKALILQMLQEMGAGANDILSEWGATGGGGGMGGPGMGWSSQPAAMYPQAGGNVKSNSDNNVNVPTTINVYGSGDALMTGQAAARASQSNVLRAVRGVVGA